jgi:mannitol 2-dehydrogenase
MSEEPVEVEIGIVHFGVGRFHRAHQAVYIDEIIQRGDHKWGMCGVCMLPQDEDIYNALKKQKGEYNVIEMDSTTTVVKKIGSIVDVLWGHEHPEDVLYTLGKKSVRIVTFTVTEAGYFYHPSTKSLDFSNAALAHDLELYRAALIHYCSPTATSDTPAALTPNPRTLFGYLSIGMLHRYLNQVKPFTVMSCDNIQGNGDMAKRLLLEFCHKVESSELKTPGKYNRFLRWLQKSVEFPNSMVDRITPAASESEIDYLRYPIKDYEDFIPVSCELYRQWVIEDKFCKFLFYLLCVVAKIFNSLRARLSHDYFMRCINVCSCVCVYERQAT